MKKLLTAILSKLLFSSLHLYDLVWLYMTKPRTKASSMYFSALEAAIREHRGKIPTDFPTPSTSNLSMHTKETERLCYNTIGIPSINIHMQAFLCDVLDMASSVFWKLLWILTIGFVGYFPVSLAFDFSILTKWWGISIVSSGLVYGLLFLVNRYYLESLLHNKQPDYFFHLFLSLPQFAKKNPLKANLALLVYNQDDNIAYKTKIQKLISGSFLLENFRYRYIDPAEYFKLIKAIINTQGCEPFWLYFLFRYYIIAGQPERIVSEFSSLQKDPKFNVYYLQLVHAMANYICDREQIPIPVYGNVITKGD